MFCLSSLIFRTLLVFPLFYFFMHPLFTLNSIVRLLGPCLADFRILSVDACLPYYCPLSKIFVLSMCTTNSKHHHSQAPLPARPWCVKFMHMTCDASLTSVTLASIVIAGLRWLLSSHVYPVQPQNLNHL